MMTIIRTGGEEGEREEKVSGDSVEQDNTSRYFYNHQQTQWNVSIKDTTGTQLVVLYREVSLIQR